MTHFARLPFRRILLLLALTFLGSAGAEPNKFSTTGSPAAGREFFSTTLLPNGKVLVAGGSDDFMGLQRTAELFDPGTGQWTATGSMADVRYYHAAVLLPTGKVLVAGGATATGQTPLAELYDPETGTWAPTGSLAKTRTTFTLTVLKDGRVLAAGGYSSDGYVSATGEAEIYDPATEQWTPTGPLNAARTGHTATLLPDGRVLVAGGGSGGTSVPEAIASAELYDPVSGTWTTTGPLALPLTDHTATLLQNGAVLVAGGREYGATVSKATQLYDAATGLWTASGSLITERYRHTATLLPNGDVLFAFGRLLKPATAGTEIWHPATGASTIVIGDFETHYNHSATLLPNDRVLITGGRGDTFTVRTSYLFEPYYVTWTNSGDLAAARWNHTALRLVDGKVLVAGGLDSASKATATAELYDPATGLWTTTGSMKEARWVFPAVLLPDGRALVAGGENDAGKLASAELYDPATGAWRATGSLSTVRSGHTLTLLANGKVLAAGGVGLRSAEVWDPATEQWTATGDLSTARYNHTANVLPNGQVLLVGGEGDGHENAEFYDPATGTWTSAGAAPFAPSLKSGFLLPTGKVLIFGGSMSYFSSTVFNRTAALYDFAAGTWKMTGSFTMATSYFAATQLNDGRVILAGGLDSGALANTEIYDAAAGLWRGAGLLNTARLYHTITPLLDGRMLVTGGLDRLNGRLASTELFDPNPGTPAAARPQIVSTSSSLHLGDSLSLTGSGLLDRTGAPALVRVRSLTSGQFAFVQPASSSLTSFTSMPLRGLLPGLLEVTATSDGIPSASVVVRLTAALPVVTTGLAANPGVSGVTLNARASAGGALTQVMFEISTEPTLQQPLAVEKITLPSSADDIPVSQSVAGLKPHTTYFYRATATNSIGSAQGEIASFTTTNTPPVAPDGTDAAAAGEARKITIGAPLNDADGDVVTLIAADGDAHLTVTGITGREISYTVAAHFAGTATITYKVSDGLATATGQITVTVPDAAPVLTVAGANPLVLAYGSPFSDPGATALDAVDGALSVSTTGSVDPTVAGPYVLTYSATDSAGHTVTATRSVTVSAAPAPVAGADRYFTASTNRTPLLLHVLDNDTAYVPSSLTIMSVSAPRLGTATISGDGQTITYTPRVQFSSFAAMDSFTYTIRDGFGVTATGQVTIGNSARDLKGVYDGLLSDGAETTGYLRVALTSTGAFTGLLDFGRSSTVIRGNFDVNNRAHLTAGGAGLTLHFAATGEPVISATLGLGNSATLTRATTHRPPETGRYTMLLPAVAGAPSTGSGYALMNVLPSGVASLVGRCGDGASWSATGFLKEDHTLALYAFVQNVPGPAGTLAGLITFEDTPQTSDCDGPLVWFKPPQTGETAASGFTVTVPALGSRFVARPGKQALDFTNHSVGSGSLAITGADLVSALRSTIAVLNNNAVSETSTPRTRLTLKIDATTGLFSGTNVARFQLGPVTRDATGILRGVLLQKQNRGAGQFIGPAHSGELLLTAQ